MTEHADATVRASGVWEILDCAFRYQAKQDRSIPANVPIAIGNAVHASTAAFDQARIGDDGGLSVDDAAGVAVDMLSHPTEEVDWSRAEMNHAEAERRALWCHTRYCHEIAPTRTYLAVEEALEPLVVRLSSGTTLELTGHVDRRRVVYGPKGEMWQGVSDLKTGARAVNADGSAKLGRHGPQLGVYQLLAEHSLDMQLHLEPEIIGLQTGGKALCGVASVPNAMRALVGTEGQPGFLDYIGLYFRAGSWPPNPGSILCSPRYCTVWPECPYHD